VVSMFIFIELSCGECRNFGKLMHSCRFYDPLRLYANAILLMDDLFFSSDFSL